VLLFVLGKHLQRLDCIVDKLEQFAVFGLETHRFRQEMEGDLELKAWCRISIKYDMHGKKDRMVLIQG
jgi:hypothetical protein